MTSATTTLDAVVIREDQIKLGLWLFLATVTMLFAAFTSAYIVRRSGSDWRHVALPSILWLNSFVLAVSSGAVEIARWRGARRAWRSSVVAMIAAVALGIVFLAGQVIAWRQMVAVGIYLPTNPYSSFFFMLTGAHAAHVVAALVVLVWGAAVTLARSADPRAWAARISICQTFWHYLGAVWLFLFALVSLY